MRYWVKIVLALLISFSFILIGTGFLIKEHEFYVVNESEESAKLLYKIAGSEEIGLEIPPGESILVCNIRKIFQRNAYKSKDEVFDFFKIISENNNKLNYDVKIVEDKKVIKYYYLIM